MEHLPYDLLSERKIESTAGTFESNAFILSLKDKNEFSTLHSFGYHRVPLVGVYGDYYHLCLPLVLISFPTTPKILQHALPESVQHALSQKCHHPSGVQKELSTMFVESYVSTLISKSEDTLINNTPSQSDDVQLVIQCYIKAILDRAVEKVQEDTSLYFIIHTQPISSPCQKFLCNNTDEINLVYHCWLFRDAPYDLEKNFTDKLNMGVFEPCGVQPVHQNLQDAGVEFGGISERTVCIHGGKFSPENAQLQLRHDCVLHTFYSVAKYPGRSVVAFHVLPADDKTENALKECLSYTIDSLLHNLNEEFPAVADVLSRILNTLADR